MMVRKIIGEWKPLPDKNIYVLTLDKSVIIKNAEDDFRNYRINGKLYKSVPMSPSLSGTKCISIKEICISELHQSRLQSFVR